MKGSTLLIFAFVIAAFLYAVHQHQERVHEQARFRQCLNQLWAQLASKEDELASLRERLGEKNEQVHLLADEIDCLRAKTRSAQAVA
jgi:chromosome segregation ATPase